MPVTEDIENTARANKITWARYFYHAYVQVQMPCNLVANVLMGEGVSLDSEVEVDFWKRLQPVFQHYGEAVTRDTLLYGDTFSAFFREDIPVCQIIPPEFVRINTYGPLLEGYAYELVFTQASKNEKSDLYPCYKAIMSRFTPEQKKMAEENLPVPYELQHLRYKDSNAYSRYGSSFIRHLVEFDLNLGHALLRTKDGNFAPIGGEVIINEILLFKDRLESHLQMIAGLIAIGREITVPKLSLGNINQELLRTVVKYIPVEN